MEKFIIEGPIEGEISVDGFGYYINGKDIQEEIWVWTYNNVMFAGKESVKNYRITIEEID